MMASADQDDEIDDDLALAGVPAAVAQTASAAHEPAPLAEPEPESESELELAQGAEPAAQAEPQMLRAAAAVGSDVDAAGSIDIDLDADPAISDGVPAAQEPGPEELEPAAEAADRPEPAAEAADRPEPADADAEPAEAMSIDEIEELDEPAVDAPPVAWIPPPPPIPAAPRTATIAPPPPPRPVVVVPPRSPHVQTMRVPPLTPRSGVPRAAASGPVPVASVPPLPTPPAITPSIAIPTLGTPRATPIPPGASDDVPPPQPARPRTPSAPPPVPPPSHAETRAHRGTPPPPLPSFETGDIELGPAPDLTAGGVEVGTAQANIVVDQPLEAHLESPTVVDRALAELGDAGVEQRAEAMTRELDAATDPAAAALLAYELGELYERRLADEARAVKAYGRALTLDPGLRANLWAIRRVFYRRGLWPNLLKLIAAEVAYARDDFERADLLLEKARVAQRLDDADECRAALDEAVRIAPHHQGALLLLERVVARASDTAALLDVWELLAEAVEQPARKIAYWTEVGRAAAPREYGRALEALDRAAALAGSGPSAERVTRERLRIAEEHGTPEDASAAIDALCELLLAAFGPGGPGSGEAGDATDRPDRATQIRRELVALRRRQAQLVRGDAPARAWDVLQQALVLAPGEPLVLGDLTELAEELGRYDDLAELVQSWQAVEGDPGRAMVLSIRRADALLRGGQREQARALLAGLEASAPGFIVLTSAAERDALGSANAGELARTYLAAAHAALLGSWLGPGQPPAPDPGAAAALYVQAAELLAYDVAPAGDAAEAAAAIDDARAALGKALEAVPGYPYATEALIELDDTTGNIGPALARLKAAAASAEGDAQRALLERAIRLARGHGELEAVLELERTLVQLAPGELALRWRLESTLAQLGRDDDRAQLMSELAALEPDATRRGTALLAAARLRERAGAVETATELYRQVLALWPDDTFSRESLIDLLRAQERWTELVAERRTEARALPDGPAARRALREAAWVLEIRLADTASAAQVYDEWLQRFDDDRTALEGAARCRAHYGDRLGEIAARRAISELDPCAETQWLLGRALERAGQFDEAADVFRALSVREETSVAASAAALALADLAAGRADPVMRLEAAAALAGRTTEPRLGAALAEDSGWMYALVLEDFERASQSFAAALALEPTRRGALLGAALVAARTHDPSALASAYEGLATSVEMPEASAALHLRAAAMSAAVGEVELANQRVAAARQAAPDDASALLVVAETASIPVVDAPAGASPEATVDALLARAEILETRSALADDPASRATWELDRAEALELAGRLREAGAVVVAVLKTQPGDLRALEALRRMSKRVGDRTTWANASFQLARLLGDPAAVLGLLRDAASVLDDRSGSAGGDRERALAIYRRILRVDPGAPELERLLELMRERADVHGLVGALTDRLTWLASDAQEISRDSEMVPLLLERATVLHGLGDQAAAMADLDALLDRAASHVEALRFRADLAFNAGEVEHAVALWRRCVAAETRPQRRAEIELRLSQVLAENVNDVAGAIENLERVVAASPDDVPLRERLLGLCLRINDWSRAVRELQRLAQLRSTPQDKAREELRLGLMLRDRTGDREGARRALERARALDPLNLDVVRELSELLDPAPRAEVLAAAAASFRTSIAQNPRSAVLYDRLAQVTGWQSDVDARWLALVGLEALGSPSADQRQVLEQGRQKLGAPGRVKLDAAARTILRGAASGPLVELWRAIAPAVRVATGVEPAKLGFTRGDRIALKKLAGAFEPLAGALACFGIEDIELYVSASRGGHAWALAGETPILCVGADVAAASTSQHRWVLGRAVATIAEGLASLPELREAELGWTIAAALRAAEVAVPAGIADEVAGEEASIAERAKVLKKEMSRKARAQVQQLAIQRGGELGDIAGFRRHALAAGHRAGLVWSGDLAVVLAQLDVGKGGKPLTDSASALELTAWSVSDEHARLRDALGVALKGSR